jgi:hypothetical protein
MLGIFPLDSEAYYGLKFSVHSKGRNVRINRRKRSSRNFKVLKKFGSTDYLALKAESLLW